MYKALSTSLDTCNKDDLSRENITYLTLSGLIDVHKNQKKKADSLLKSSFKKLFEKGYGKSIQVLINDTYLHDYFSSKELLSLLFNSKSPFTKKILKFFKDNPQFKYIFEEHLREYEQYDQKRTEKTSKPSDSAKDYTIGILEVIIDPDINKLYSEFDRIERK